MKRIKLALMATLLGGCFLSTNYMKQEPTPLAGSATAQKQSCVGMWVTKDGHIRHELLPNGRYDEARGNRKSAYQGRYTLTGDHIDYVDDTGFTADGDFRDGVLYHAGMVFYREKEK